MPASPKQPQPQQRRRKFRLAIAAFLIIALSGGLFFMRSAAQARLNNDAQTLSHAIWVKTAILDAVSHYPVRSKYSGTIVAARESDHGFDRGGLLAQVLVDEGEQVKKGAVLARLDMRRFDARQDELAAEQARAIAFDQEVAALLDRAQAIYDRNVILLDKKHISQQRFDQVKFDLIALEARKLAANAAVTKAKAALDSLKTDRALATLTARFDGRVVRRYLDEGAAFGPGTPVIRLIEDGKLEIHVGLPAVALPGLIVGGNYIFDSHGNSISARLRTLLPRLDQATRTVTAIFDISDKNCPVRAGELAGLTIKQQIEQDGFWLPVSALAESRRGLWSAYSLEPFASPLINAGNKTNKDDSSPHQNKNSYFTLQRQELQVLYTESDRVFVRGTVQNGQRIVTDGLHRLVPGQLVRISGNRK